MPALASSAFALGRPAPPSRAVAVRAATPAARDDRVPASIATSAAAIALLLSSAEPAHAQYIPHGKLLSEPVTEEPTTRASAPVVAPAPPAPSRAVPAAPTLRLEEPASPAADVSYSRPARVPINSQPSSSDGGNKAFALVTLLGAAGVGGLLVATDPQKRREAQMQQVGGDELKAVKSYFEDEGFKRWDKIYGETDEVNKVQLDIRQGHAQTVDKVLRWLDEEGGVKGLSVADCGCGTGSLTVPLALRGAAVSASDISQKMADEARRRYQVAVSEGGSKPEQEPVFEAKDLESVTGKYHTVACLDVMIHYPQDKADAMISHLASLADKRLVISFAPKTPYYSFLKRVGELFPGPSKATRAYLHAEEDVERALAKAGFRVTKREMTATSFYFSRLLEAVRT